MAGGIIQLVAYNTEDLFLTGDPEITFFKIVYRRHTNFAIESVVQNFPTSVTFGSNSSCSISYSGDLINNIVLYVELPPVPKFYDAANLNERFKKFAWVKNLGHALIQEVAIEIGGKVIDRQYGEWLHIWSQVSSKQDVGLDKMIGNIPELYNFSNGKEGYKIYVPLQFWFCKEVGLSLPLVSLSSSEVKINVLFRKLSECCRIGPTSSMKILEDIVPFAPGDYIYQTIGGDTIQAYVMDYDYLEKKLYYIKIQDKNALLKNFEAYQEGGDKTTPCAYPAPKHNLFRQIKQSILESENIITTAHCPTPILKLPSVIIDNANYSKNIPYRIYKLATNNAPIFCTPQPNTKEAAENTITPELRFVNCWFYVDYIYLDSEERAKFIRSNHEYLIEQVQFNKEINVKSPNVLQHLTLSHPCKALYWVIQLDSLVGPGTINDTFRYVTLTDEELMLSAKLMLNGHDRFSERSAAFFNLLEPYQHHSRGPEEGIYMYSPAIYPESLQPSSTINMSKIDLIEMLMKLSGIVSPKSTVSIRSYTLNYNIFRIFFNVGGLAFV